MIKKLETTSTWLITGVAGFIGLHLLETLLKLNQNVVGIDNFYSGHQANIDVVLKQTPAEKKQNYIFYEGDIRSETDCKNVMKGVDFVLHQAALSSVPKSIECVALTHEVNVDGFFNVIKAARDAKVKRFIYASSCAVYGNTNSLPNKETQPADLISPYNV